jgi:hypothetical protein
MRKQRVLSIETFKDGSENGQVKSRAKLCLASSAHDTEQAAAKILKSVNVQLEHTGSRIRMAVVDVNTGKLLQVKFTS